MYIKKNNLSIIHIPKTGGTSINKDFFSRKHFFKPLVTCHLGHLALKEIYERKMYDFEATGKEKIVEIDLNEKYGVKTMNGVVKSKKISIVRHPVTRMISYYQFVKQYERDFFPEINEMSFEEFLLENETILSSQRAFWKQCDYLFYKNKTVDYVIKFENLVSIEKVFLDLGINFKLKNHELKTDKSYFNLSSTALEIIENKYKDDFNTFEYEVEDFII